MRSLLTLGLLAAVLSNGAGCDDGETTTADLGAGSDTVTADIATHQDGPGVDAQVADTTADTAAADTATADTATADAMSSDASTSDSQTADGAINQTSCGSLKCNKIAEVCVINEAQLKSYVCKSVPTGCEKKRTCACLGASVCTGVFKLCVDNKADNTVTCSCPNC